MRSALIFAAFCTIALPACGGKKDASGPNVAETPRDITTTVPADATFAARIDVAKFRGTPLLGILKENLSHSAEAARFVTDFSHDCGSSIFDAADDLVVMRFTPAKEDTVIVVRSTVPKDRGYACVKALAKKPAEDTTVDGVAALKSGDELFLFDGLYWSGPANRVNAARVATGKDAALDLGADEVMRGHGAIPAMNQIPKIDNATLVLHATNAGFTFDGKGNVTEDRDAQRVAQAVNGEHILSRNHILARLAGGPDLADVIDKVDLQMNGHAVSVVYRVNGGADEQARAIHSLIALATK